MKYIFLTTFASILGISFVLTCRYESQMPGDIEWAIYYSVLFATIILASLLTSSSRAVLAIGTLAPLVGMGMFVIVNILFSAGVTYTGILLAGGTNSFWGKSSRSQPMTEEDETVEP